MVEMEVKLIPEFSSEIFLLQSLKRRKFKTKKFYTFVEEDETKLQKSQAGSVLLSEIMLGPVWFVGPLTHNKSTS